MARPVEGVLTALARREPLVRRLREGPAPKGELVGGLDVSRSTVDRWIRELERREFVERTADGYRLTLRGRLSFEEYERCVGRLEALEDAGPVLASLPPDCELDAAALEGAEVVTAGRATPYRPIERHLDAVLAAGRIRAISVAVMSRHVDIYHERVMQGELEAEIAVTPEALQQVLSSHSEQLRVGLQTGRVEVRELADPPPFSLFLIDCEGDTHVGVMVFTGEGVRGYVDNTTDAAVDWGERVFERYWERAEPVTPGKAD